MVAGHAGPSYGINPERVTRPHPDERANHPDPDTPGRRRLSPILPARSLPKELLRRAPGPVAQPVGPKRCRPRQPNCESRRPGAQPRPGKDRDTALRIEI